jgi:5-formyltetrahydrofolate cyclo-ligase
MTKSELRTLYRQKRATLSTSDHAELSRRIFEKFFHEIDLTAVGKLHCFISMRHAGEIDTAPIFERLWREHPEIETFAPRIDETTGELASVEYTSTSTLKTNKWNIDEPADEKTIDPATIDLVIVPLLCFDERGHRVGYGKGFYDRFLKKCRPDRNRAGLSFFPPVKLIDDVHLGDVPLDVCITPERAYRWPTHST